MSFSFMMAATADDIDYDPVSQAPGTQCKKKAKGPKGVIKNSQKRKAAVPPAQPKTAVAPPPQPAAEPLALAPYPLPGVQPPGFAFMPPVPPIMLMQPPPLPLPPPPPEAPSLSAAPTTPPMPLMVKTKKGELVSIVDTSSESDGVKAEDTEACALCLEPMASPFWPWANCTHVVHKECAVHLVKYGTKRECPVCRTCMSMRELHELTRLSEANPEIGRGFQKTICCICIHPSEVHPRHLLPLCCNRLRAVDDSGNIEYSCDRRMRFAPVVRHGQLVRNKWVCYTCGREVSENDRHCRDCRVAKYCDMFREGIRWYACLDQLGFQQPVFSTCMHRSTLSWFWIPFVRCDHTPNPWV